MAIDFNLTRYRSIVYYSNSITFYGGCHDIAKRTINPVLPTLMLKTTNKGVVVESISKPLKFHPHEKLPPNYKLNYGIRFSGFHEESQRPLFYGFDLFYQVSGNGLDLEGFLSFCKENDFLIDWYNFQRTSIERGGWSFKTLVRKVSYPVIDVFGETYWNKLKWQFMRYEWSLMLPEDKEKFRHLFE